MKELGVQDQPRGEGVLRNRKGQRDTTPCAHPQRPLYQQRKTWSKICWRDMKGPQGMPSKSMVGGNTQRRENCSCADSACRLFPPLITPGLPASRAIGTKLQGGTELILPPQHIVHQPLSCLILLCSYLTTFIWVKAHRTVCEKRTFNS